jgi:transposase
MCVVNVFKKDCKTLIQIPVPAQVIDKGVPTAALLAHIMIAKMLPPLPLYHNESIFSPAHLAIPRSTLASWVDNCGAQLQPLSMHYAKRYSSSRLFMLINRRCRCRQSRVG